MTSPDTRPVFTVNELAIIERFDRPWRLTNIVAIDGDVITVTGGFHYAADTGERLDAQQSYTKNERLTSLTPDGAAYLTIMAFQQELPRFELRSVPRRHRVALAQLIHAFCDMAGMDLGALSRIPLLATDSAVERDAPKRRSRKRTNDRA